MIDGARLLLSVFKLRIGVAIMLCTLAGAAVAPSPDIGAGIGPDIGSGIGPGAMAVLALAVLLSSCAAGAFNQYAERGLDARMARTRSRPFVTGRYTDAWYWPAGIAALLLAAVAAAALAANLLAALFVFLGAFTYGVIYTLWLKRRTWLNIVIGGLAGSFAVLAGASAVDPGLSPAPVILAVVLFLWTPPHFWSLAFAFGEDYRRAGVPMLPVVVGERTAARVILAHTVALVAVSLLPAAFGMGWLYVAGAAVGGALFLRGSLRLARNPGRRNAMANFHASLAQLGLLLLGALADAAL